MEAFRQMRVRFSGAGEEDTAGVRDQRIPPQKTQSFKGENRKGEYWFRRPPSREMNRDYDDTDGEYSTAVAAAAFAINNLEESRLRGLRETSESPDSNLTNLISKPEDKRTRAAETRTLSKKNSDEVSVNRPNEVVGPTPSIKRNTTSVDKRSKTTGTTGSAPSIKKTPTFTDTNPSSPATTKPENLAPVRKVPSTKQSTIAPTEIKTQPELKPGTGNTKADTWEKTELMKIKERYEKVSAKILDWETKKKTKAKRRLERPEAQLDKKRAKALQHYRNKMKIIDQIARGERAQADGNRRNEELKVKEKANKIRETGEVPVTCFCC